MLQIYGVPISVHTRKVIISALEKGIAFASEPVIPFDPPPRWNELSPTGKIPVAVDGDLVLRDSSVICTYLERAYGGRALYPADTRALVQALWLEEYADGTVFREIIHGLFFQQVIRPNILKQPTDAAAIAAILEASMPRVFDYLEQCATGEYLAGAAFGIADIAVVSNLINFYYLGYRLERHPNLLRYFRTQLERPSLRRALDAEQPVAASMGLDHGSLKMMGSS
jgi:glutathione S-transferase